jgi:hypothetical protein
MCMVDSPRYKHNLAKGARFMLNLISVVRIHDAWARLQVTG